MKNIKVEKSLWRELKSLKLELDLKRFNEVVEILLESVKTEENYDISEEKLKEIKEG